MDPAPPPISKLIIAIHGIGSQRRSDTIRSVARRFGSRSDPPLPVMPLGFFFIGKVGEVHFSRLEAGRKDPLAAIGFAEVFWADIPKAVVKEEDTLEETKAWARSVVSRAQSLYMRKVAPTCLPLGLKRWQKGGPTKERQLGADDFALGAGVIEEIVETVAVMENLLAVADKAGVFKFDLAPLLRDYIGDVQLVTEFSHYRNRIVYRFHDAMVQIVRRFKEKNPGSPEIHIVAHSEGTVVAFMALLQAIESPTVTDPMDVKTTISTDWIQYVHGFMTIGSPIDKHLALWPGLWDDMKIGASVRTADWRVVLPAVENVNRPTLPGRIRWRNYYDYGDPIGFKLDTARRFLTDKHCGAFEFDPQRHDIGFSRYWLPGKAHNDYWDDAEVFGHFIDDVVLPPVAPKGPQGRPKNRFGRGVVGTAIPYALSAVLHFAAVFVLFKALTAFLTSTTDSKLDFAEQVGLLALLLMGVTVAARLPRLVRRTDLRWTVVAALALAAGIVPCLLYLPAGLAEFVGNTFQAGPLSGLDPVSLGKGVLAVGATLVAATGWIAVRAPRIGRRLLVASGCALILFIIVGRLFFDNDANKPIWPVVLAGAGFLYLWWLGILLFDLAFIWHRYIRQSVAVDVLAGWRRGEDAMPKTVKEICTGRP